MEIIEIILLIFLIIATFYNKKPQKIEEKCELSQEKVQKNEKNCEVLEENAQEIKEEKIKKAFKNLMEYDYDTALKKEEYKGQK